MLRIALAQVNPCVGALSSNADKIIANIKKAKSNGADIVVFPELALAGYPPEDLLLKPHFIEENLRCLKLIKNECKGISAFIGFADKFKDKIYNSCAFIQDGNIRDIYHKIYLPNYGVFDEKRYFTGGETLSFYAFGGWRFCVSICEDIWRKDFTSYLSKKNLDFVINISASPFHLGKLSLRQNTLSLAARKIKAFMFYCDLVGGQDELIFDGASMVLSPRGEILKSAKRFCEDLLFFELNKNKRYPFKKSVYKCRDDEEAFLALRLGLCDYVRKNGFEKVLVGVSGGIDSAVVVALASLSLGKENVVGLIMPSGYSSQETLADAKKICRNAGIKYHIFDIDGIFKYYLQSFAPFFKGKKEDKTEENLQARIRGNILMAFSNKFNYLVLNTGNKSEVSTGYCTLYGDMVGGFGVLKDVPKLLVYRIANYINRISGKKFIPDSVIKRPPTAELKPNQKDEDTLPPYKMLDPIVKLYVEDDYSLEQIIKAGFDKALVKKVTKMIDASEYKRRQAPLGIKITPRAFGKDRRMPITNRFNY
jgi:NAD+ synthase (glutamine-hydrolysing)